MFAEHKLQRDGIEVLTGRRVMGVTERMINMRMKATGEDVSIPHGMVVWSTGIGVRPVVKDFMEKINQVFLKSLTINTHKITLSFRLLHGHTSYSFFFLIQGYRRVLATDEWLRVKGCDDVYALGDCASLDQKKIVVTCYIL